MILKTKKSMKQKCVKNVYDAKMLKQRFPNFIVYIHESTNVPLSYFENFYVQLDQI